MFFTSISNTNQVYSKKLSFLVNSENVFSTLYSDSSYSFWLDSSMISPNLSRFSFMGDADGSNSFIVKYKVKSKTITIIKKNKSTSFQGDIFTYLAQFLNNKYCCNNELPFDFNCGFVGYFGYELKSLSETHNVHESNLPDAQFIFADRLIVFDHQEKNIYLLYLDKKNHSDSAINWFEKISEQLSHFKINKPSSSATFVDKISPKLKRNKQQYLEDIKICLNKIKDGESYEICLTNQFHFSPITQPFLYYCDLRKNNPVPYGAYFKLDDNFI